MSPKAELGLRKRDAFDSIIIMVSDALQLHVDRMKCSQDIYEHVNA